MPWVLAAVGVALLGPALWWSGGWGVAAVAAVPVALVLASRAKWLALLVAVWAPVQYGLTRDGAGVLPYATVFVDEAALALLAIAIVLRFASRREEPRGTPLDAPLLAFVAIGVLSGVVNGNPAWDTVLGIRGVVQYAILYYAVVHVVPAGRSFTRHALVALAGMAALHVPVAAWQMARAWGVAGDVLVDAASGLVHDANGLSMVLAPFVAVALAPSSWRSGVRAALASWFVAGVLLGQGRFSILVLPLLVVAVIGAGRVRIAHVVAGVLLVATVAAGGLALLRHAGVDVARHYGPLVLARDQVSVESGSGRLLYYPVAWEVLRDDSAFTPIGTGPGTFSSFTGYRLEPRRVRYIRDFFGQSAYGFDWAVDSQVIATGVEFGPLGLCAFYWLLWRVWRLGRAVRRGGAGVVAEHAMIAAGARGFALMLALGAWVCNAWETQYLAMPMWLFAALAVRALDVSQPSRCAVPVETGRGAVATGPRRAGV